MPNDPTILENDKVGATETFRDLDPKIRARELASFREEVVKLGPIHPTKLQDWKAGSIDRQRLLAGVIFGGIRWPKSLGRPRTTNLVDAFEIVHQRQVINGGVDSSGTLDWNKVEALPTPAAYDASTADDYRVAFQLFADQIWQNFVFFRLREEPWERPAGVTPGFRFLEPQRFDPFSNRGETVIYPDVQLRYISFARLSIRALK